MLCIKCGAAKTRTVKTIDKDMHIKRIRFCPDCEALYKTIEGVYVEEDQAEKADSLYLEESGKICTEAL